MRISLTIAVLALAAPLAAVEQLVVGDGGLSFLDARETSNRLSVLTDSIWIWDIEDGQNIAEQVLQRGGAIFPVVVRQADFGPSVQLPFAPSLENIVDGDAKTSFSPAEIGREKGTGEGQGPRKKDWLNGFHKVLLSCRVVAKKLLHPRRFASPKNHLACNWWDGLVE